MNQKKLVLLATFFAAVVIAFSPVQSALAQSGNSTDVAGGSDSDGVAGGGPGEKPKPTQPPTQPTTPLPPDARHLAELWLIVMRADESKPNATEAVAVDPGLLRQNPRLMEAFSAADVLHEELKGFISGPKASMPILPSYVSTVSYRDLDAAAESILFTYNEQITRTNDKVSTYTAYVEYEGKIYQFTIQAIERAPSPKV